MVLPVLALLLVQPEVCAGAGVALTIAAAHVRSLDPGAAVSALSRPEHAACPAVEIGRVYLEGLLAARTAYARGGGGDALVPVTSAAARLQALGAGRREVEVARLVLVAAAAAAQSERDEMGLFLAQAVDLEARQLAAGERGAPLSSAHETAGDLWLQVHRYEDARLAYQRAAALLGDTPRLAAGFARVAARTGDEVIACYQFRSLLTWWNGRAGTLPEIAEAREYVREHGCRTP